MSLFTTKRDQFERSRAWDARRASRGPTRNDQTNSAMRSLLDQGYDFENADPKQATRDIQAEVEKLEAPLRNMRYDTSQRRLIPSAEDTVREGRAQLEAQIEKDRQKLGLSAEDYWERNPESKRTAINSRGETVDVMDLAREFQQSQADRADQQARVAAMREKGRKLARDRRDEQVLDRYSELNLPYTPTKEDGSFDADRAQGILARSTFQGWDDQRTLERQAKQLERDARQERAYIRRAQRGAYGIAAQNRAMEPDQQARRLQLDTQLNQGYRDKGIWRNQAESLDRAQTLQRMAEDNLKRANKATAASLEENRARVSDILGKLLADFQSGDMSSEKFSQMNALLAAIAPQQ